MGDSAFNTCKGQSQGCDGANVLARSDAAIATIAASALQVSKYASSEDVSEGAKDDVSEASIPDGAKRAIRPEHSLQGRCSSEDASADYEADRRKESAERLTGTVHVSNES